MIRADRQNLLCPLLAVFAVGLGAFAATGPRARAQDKGEPGKFDFYLMNVAAPTDFCRVPGAGPACKAPRSFVLHGLWTQFRNGSYPVNCSSEPGPAHLKRFLDLTPDLPLLQHEWDKHGTCTAVGPERFFAMERRAFRSLRLPRELEEPKKDRTVATADLLHDLLRINTGFPEGAILLSCRQGKLTAVEACFSKELRPMRCEGLRGCEDSVVTVEASSAGIKP